tara:strand:+ start:74 stop:658 length:585 start_codon:yes stop_codon:yes gene_type:complete
MSTWQKYQALGALDKFGVSMGVAGLFSKSYAGFAAARSERLRTKSLALRLKHKEDMMRFNIRQNESQAQWLNAVYNKKYQIATLKQGNRKSTAKTSFAARGIQMGVGSTKDVFVSSEVLNTIENLTMNSNKVRAITNQRLKGVGMEIKADMTGLSADFKNMTAASIDPFMSMTSSFMSGSSNFMANLPQSLLTK